MALLTMLVSTIDLIDNMHHASTDGRAENTYIRKSGMANRELDRASERLLLNPRI